MAVRARLLAGFVAVVFAGVVAALVRAGATRSAGGEDAAHRGRAAPSPPLDVDLPGSWNNGTTLSFLVKLNIGRSGTNRKLRPTTTDKDTAVQDTETRIHAWRIEEREYRRQEERRGRRFAYPSITPDRTALVVIDMVPFFVDANPYARGIVPNIQRLANRLRAAGGAVAWVLPARTERTAVGDEFHGPEAAEMFRNSGGTGPLPGRLWPGFATDPGDIFVEKSAPSAFFPGRCRLTTLLEEHGIDTILITGTVTQVCCEASARDASTLGYRVVMVADANATGRDQDHNATLATIYRSFGDVRSTAEVLAMIGAPTPTRRRSPDSGSPVDRRT